MSTTVTCPACRCTFRFAARPPAGAVPRCPKCGAAVALPPPPASDGTVVAPSGGVPGPAPAAAAASARLGPYRILETLGVGGMGRVYRAEDPALRRQVALKVMLPHLAANPESRARFLREARAQAQVEHDHVVVVHLVDEDAGVPFIAMPLLRGQTLADALAAGGPPPLGEALRIAREAAEGLAAAHERGLVHRDIKPANVWLEGGRRRVKILDSGLARVKDAADAPPADAEATLVDAGATLAGAVVGTPLYMSPEQARGEAVDFRTDLCSLGVVLYQLTTGALPFTGATTAEVLVAVGIDTPPAPHAVNPAVPPAVSDLVERLMAKDPARRPASAAAVADELAALAVETGRVPAGIPHPNFAPSADPWARVGDSAVTEPAPRARARRGVRWLRARPLVGLAAGVVTILLGVVVLARAMTPTGVLVVEGEDAELVVRRDGAEVARTRARRVRLPAGMGYTLEVAGAKPGQVVTPARVAVGAAPAVVTVSTAHAKAAPRPAPRAAPATGNEMPDPVLEPAEDPEALALVNRNEGWLAVSPDGRHLAVPVYDPTPKGAVMDAATGTVRHTFGGFRDRVFRVAVSPDNALVAAASLDGTVGVWEAATGKQVRVLAHAGPALAVAFAPDGKSLAASGFAAVRAWDTATWQERFTVGGQASHSHGLAHSPAGTFLAVATQDGVVRLLDPTDGAVLHTVNGPSGTIGLAFRPDGRQLAAGGDRHLRVWEVPSGRVVYAKDGVAAAWQQFTPSGRELWTGPWSAAPATDGSFPALTRWDAAGRVQAVVALPRLAGYVTFGLPADGSVLYAAGGGRLWSYDALTGAVRAAPEPPAN